MDAVVALLNIGQGDCTVAIDREARAGIIVDCPGGRHSLALGALSALGASSVALAVISHSHWDHSGGMLKVVTNIPSREVRFNFDKIIVADARAKIKLLSMLRSFVGLRDRGVKLHHAYAGDCGQVGVISWRALAPTHDQILQALLDQDPNHASVILMLTVGRLRVLVPGDADGRSWRGVLERGEDVRADIIKVPHHGGSLPAGADRASLSEVLDAVDASYSIISVGSSNSYGHPDPGTLRELQRRRDHTRVMCTQVNATCLGVGTLPRNEASELPQATLIESAPRPGEYPCAGTIVVEVQNAGWTVMPDIPKHRRVIDALDNPMCLSPRAGEMS
jgi:competence protein ComEC